MSFDFLSTTELASLQDDMETVFQTMSSGRNIIVVKEPLKVVVNTPSTNNLFGFGEFQGDPTYTYTPVTGIFPAIIRYNFLPTNPLNPEINVRIDAGPTVMKVKQDCRDFIQNGKTEHILADGKTFLIDSEEKRQMFQDTTYYFYNLKSVL